MNPLSLLEQADQRLKSKAENVPDLGDPGFQSFIDELIRCGRDNLGVGIAAPQVGKSCRLFIMEPKPNPRYPEAPAMDAMAVINPEIIRLSSEMETGWEGCLSVPGFRGKVPRHFEADVTFLDRSGQRHYERYSGFMARLFQHEFDHLEGVLYPERMAKGEPLVTLGEFTALTGIVVPN